MSSAAFVKMIEAYRDTLGAAYPRQDMPAVIKVFLECAKDQTTTQDRVRQTTGLSAGNLSKLVKRACEEGWLRTAASRGADGTKQVSLTAKGRKTLEQFETRCTATCSDVARAAARSRVKKSRRSLIAEKGREHTLRMFNEDGTPRIP